MAKYFSKIFLIFIFFVSSASLANDLILSPPEEKYFNDSKKPSAYQVFAKEIREVEYYLNSFLTLSAEFKQSNKDGNIRYGKIFISKPGKIRCEYLPPSPMLMVIKSGKLMLYDYNLDEVSYASSDINSLNLLAEQNLSFSDIDLFEIEKSTKTIEFTIRENIKNTDERLLLTLTFTYPKISLLQINILSEGSDTNLILQDVKYNQRLGKELFSFNRDIIRKNKK